MFGYFKLDKECPPPISHAYKKYYCLLCRGIQKHYGLLARFLLSYDVAFLMVFLDKEDTFHHLSRVPCIKRFSDLSDACMTPLIKQMAALNVLLAAGKLDDDRIDDGDMKSLVGKVLFSRSICKAKRDFPQMWKIISEEYANIRQLEQRKESLDNIETAFSIMMIRLAIEVFNVHEEAKISMLSAATKWLYFIDAVDDLDENIAKHTFNPLAYMKSSDNLKNREYLQIASHFRGFYRQKLLMDGNINAAIINRVFYYGVPEETLRIISKRRGKR